MLGGEPLLGVAEALWDRAHGGHLPQVGIMIQQKYKHRSIIKMGSIWNQYIPILGSCAGKIAPSGCVRPVLLVHERELSEANNLLVQDSE